MAELGIDLAGRTPQLLTRELADVVVTMGCGDACPYIPGKRYVDWELPDPAGRPIAEVRATRDEIAHRVQSLLQELDSAAPHQASSPIYAATDLGCCREREVQPPSREAARRDCPSVQPEPQAAERGAQNA